MSGLDVGPASDLLDRASKIRLSEAPRSNEMIHSLRPADPSEVGKSPIMSRILEIMGPEDFVSAQQLDAAQRIGMTYQHLPKEQQAILDRYGQAAQRANADVMLAESLSHTSIAEDAVRVGAKAGLTGLQLLTQGVEAAASGISSAGKALSLVGMIPKIGEDAMPRALNRALFGLDQGATPDLGAWTRARFAYDAINNDKAVLEAQIPKMEAGTKSADPATRDRATKALAEAQKKIAGLGDVPEFQDFYNAMLAGDALRKEDTPIAQRIMEGAVDVVANVRALSTGPIAKMVGSGSKAIGLEALHLRLLQAAKSESSGIAARIGKGLAWAGAEATSPLSTAFAAQAGTTTAPAGARPSGLDSAVDAAVSMLAFPVYSAISRGAAELANSARGDGATILRQFAGYVEGATKEDAAAWMGPGGTMDRGKAFAAYVRDGMPGAGVPVTRRALAIGINGALEGIGFSMLDRAWWHDIGTAMADNDPKAAIRAMESVMSNGLAMTAMHAGGIAKAVDIEAVRKIGERVGRDPFASPEDKAKEPAKAAQEQPKPEDAPTEPKPVEAVSEAPKAAVEARPPEDVKVPEPTPAEPLEISEPDPHVRTEKLLESKAALQGLGEPVADGVHLLYDGQTRPKLVRYNEGKYEVRDALDTEAKWRPSRTKDGVPKLRDKPLERQPIPEQELAVDPVAARLLDPKLGLTPEQLGVAKAAVRAVARIDAKTDQGVALALEAAKQIDPSTWSPAQVGAWVQMVLRGGSPQAMAAAVQAFQQAAGKPAPFEPAVEAQAQTPDILTAGPTEVPAAPVATAEPTSSTGEAPATQQHRPIPESILRMAAKASGIEIAPDATREQIEAALKNEGIDMGGEAGLGHTAKIALSAIIAGSTGMAILAGGLPAVWTVSGLMGLAAAIKGRAYAAHQINRLLTHFGPEKIGAALSQSFTRQADKVGMIRAALTQKALPLLWRLNGQRVDFKKFGARESAIMAAGVLGVPFASHLILGGAMSGALGLGAGLASSSLLAGLSLRAKMSSGEVKRVRRDAKARKMLETEVDSQLPTGNGITDKDGYFATVNKIYGDDWIKPGSGVSRNVKALLKQQFEFLQEPLRQASAVGDTFKKRDKSYVDPIYLLDIKRIATHFLPEYYDIVAHPTSHDFKVLVAAYASANTMKPEDVKAIFAEKVPGEEGPLADHVNLGIEQARAFRYHPSGIISNGRRIRTTEDRPFQVAQMTLLRTPARLGYVNEFGPEADKEYLDAHPLTTRQERNRDLLRDYVKQADSPRDASTMLTRVQRAAHEIPIDRRRAWMSPGGWPSTVYHAVLAPARALWSSMALSRAFLVNITEPFGVPAAYTSMPQEAKAMGAVWWAAFADRKRFLQMEQHVRTNYGASDIHVPDFGSSLTKDIGTVDWGETLARQLRWLAAPMQAVNHINDIVVAHAGENIVDYFKSNPPMSKQERANWIEKLRQTGFDTQQAERMVDGNAVDSEYADWINRLRRFTMGVRTGAEKAYTQLFRISRDIAPFQSYAANNWRVWSDAFEALVASRDPNLTKEERWAKRTFFIKTVGSKAIANAAGLMALNLWQFQSAALQAFQTPGGDFDWEEAMSEYAKYFAMSEIGGFAVGSMMRLATQGVDDFGEAVTGLARSIPAFNMIGVLVDAAQNNGIFKNRARKSGLGAVVDKVMLLPEAFSPVLRDTRMWAEDQMMTLAIRQYYKVFPLPPGAGKDPTTEWVSAMRRFRTNMLAHLERPENWDPNTFADLLKEASEEGKRGWSSVATSIKDMRLVENLSPADRFKLEASISKPLYDKLVEHDRALDRHAAWAKAHVPSGSSRR